MKKAIIFILGCLISVCCFAQEFEMKLIAKFENDKNKVYIRRYEEVAPQDDISKNYLIFTAKGDLCIYQADTSRMIYLNKNFALEKDVKMNLLIGPYDCKYTENHLLMSDKSGRIYLFDLQLNRKAYFETFNVLDTNNTGVWLGECYYDESADILFFRDTKQGMHSIVHPSMNDAENRKNYRNPEKTREMFYTTEYFTEKHLSLYKEKYLVVDGIINYWGRENYGKYTYQIVNSYFVNLRDEKKSTPIKFEYDSEDEIESIAIHPSGDIYVLRMNWQTNTHNLYYIENTWNPEWRELWYTEHPSAVRP